jgi:mannose-1-phosphate guanylyltransferase
VGRYLKCDPEGNQHNCAMTQMNASDNLVFSQTGQHIALLGVQDLIVVASKDAILITSRAQAESIKKMADLLPKELR